MAVLSGETELALGTIRVKLSRNAYRILVEKPERKRPLERPRSRWEDNNKNWI